MKRPLVYYAVSFFVGCMFSLLIFEKNEIVGVVVAASFFILFFFNVDKRFFLLMILFFLLGIISFKLYFSIKIYEGVNVRVVQKNLYYSLGDFKGRKVTLRGNLKDVEEGDRIKVFGTFEHKIDFQRGNIGVFTIKKYKVLEKDTVFHLYYLKKVVYEELKKYLSEDKTALVMALGYGETKYLSNTQKNEFQLMGVVHAVSVSGFHMAIIYKVLEKTVGIKIAILVSFFYLLFTGLQAATMRAFIMILIFKLSHMLFKDYDSISSLSMSALVILFFKPYYALDIGFALSFSATFGIIIYYKKISKALYKLPKTLNESISVSLSSQVFSVPYIAFTIQSFSTGFMIGNIILLPLYSIVVVLSNIMLIFIKVEFIFKLLAYVLDFALNSIVGADYFILKLCPPVSLLGYLDGIILVLMYISYLMYKYKNKRYKYVPVFIACIFFIKDLSFIPQVYYFDVYKGQAIILRYNKENVMVCNYDNESVKDIIALKKNMKIDKIFTNPKSNVDFKLNNNLEGSVVMENNRSILNIKCGQRNFQVEFLPKDINNKIDSIESSSLYVIMFNRVIRID